MIKELDNCTISPYGNYIVVDGFLNGEEDRIQVRRATDGTKVIFASDWDKGTYPVQAYVVDTSNQ